MTPDQPWISVSISKAFGLKVNSWAHPRPAELESVGKAQKLALLTSLPGDSQTPKSEKQDSTQIY